MKMNFLIRISLVLFIFVLIAGLGVDFLNPTTGKAVEEHRIGPSMEEQTCMMSCMKCSSPGVGCTGNQQECQTKCNVQKPEVTEETSCMEICVLVGCGEFDFSCQGTNKDRCEKECNMIKEPEAKSEEERCIRDCVNQAEPGLICQAGEGGEKGGEICQRCAEECKHLYAGPCLDEEKLEAKKSECNTCPHCYGEPVMGDSGEGYQCIVGIVCKDASAMFGDDPGTGEGIATSIVGRISEGVGNVFESIGDFFTGIFGGESRAEAPEDNSVSENVVASENAEL